MWKKTKECPWHAETKLDHDRPPSATTCLEEFTHLGNIFGHSTLGTACCSCGKSVKLTGLGKFWSNYAASEKPGNFFLKCELLLSATKLNNNLIGRL